MNLAPHWSSVREILQTPLKLSCTHCGGGWHIDQRQILRCHLHPQLKWKVYHGSWKLRPIRVAGQRNVWNSEGAVDRLERSRSKQRTFSSGWLQLGTVERHGQEIRQDARSLCFSGNLKGSLICKCGIIIRGAIDSSIAGIRCFDKPEAGAA